MSAPAIALPALLAPWRAWLAPLADDVQAWLGAALLQLQRLLPAPGAAMEQPQGEFAGYRGISRRGLPERLLATEWLYATELPDEFLRRYGSGESLHLDPALEDPAAERLQLVLFDSGPVQLGACRLAHLALWVLLAQRADALRQRWAFASLGADPAGLCERSDLDGWRRLLTARTAALVDDSQLARWSARLAELKPCVVWLIGAPDTPTPTRPALTRLERLHIAELPRLDDRALLVENDRARITLPLPPARLAARLLRDPLASAPAPTAIRTMDSKLWSGLPDLPLRHRVLFSGDGHRMLVRLADDRSVLQLVPNAPRATLPDGRLLTTSADTLAVRINKRSISELRRGEDGTWQLLRALGLPGPTTVPQPDSGEGMPVGQRWLSLWRCGAQLLLLDAQGTLRQFQLAPGGGIKHAVLAVQVLSVDVREEAGTFSYVASSTESTRLCTDHGRSPQQLPRAMRALHRGESLFLKSSDQDWWTLGADHAGLHFRLAPEEQVIGCWKQKLVCAIPGQAGVTIYTSGQPTWVALPHEPLSPGLSPHGVLASFNRDRELVLHSLDRQCELRRFRGGGAAAP